MALKKERKKERQQATQQAGPLKDRPVKYVVLWARCTKAFSFHSGVRRKANPSASQGQVEASTSGVISASR